jgi:hypothetical protein
VEAFRAYAHPHFAWGKACIPNEKFAEVNKIISG